MQKTTESNTGTSKKTKKSTGSEDLTANEKISRAIDLVKEARNDKIEQTRSTLEESYAAGLDKANELNEQARAFLNDSKQQAKKTYNETKQATEERIKAKPFQFVLGAGILGLVLGFLFGFKRR